MSVLALAGGVGGAKLCLGLARNLGADDLQIVVNTGDDEEFYGLPCLARPGYGHVHTGRSGQPVHRLGNHW